MRRQAWDAVWEDRMRDISDAARLLLMIHGYDGGRQPDHHVTLQSSRRPSLAIDSCRRYQDTPQTKSCDASASTVVSPPLQHGICRGPRPPSLLATGRHFLRCKRGSSLRDQRVQGPRSAFQTMAVQD